MAGKREVPRQAGQTTMQARALDEAPEAPPTAAGGDHRAQLVHLKAHLKSQRQDRSGETRTGWCTVITRAESRRHITRQLHEKINAKVPEFYTPGKVNTEEGQRKLASTVNHAQRGNFFGSDDNVTLPWKLRYRIYRSRYPRHGDRAFWELVGERIPPPVRPKEAEFPLEVRVEMAERRRRREHLRELPPGTAGAAEGQPQAVAAGRGPHDVALSPLLADLPGRGGDGKALPGMPGQAVL